MYAWLYHVTLCPWLALKLLKMVLAVPNFRFLCQNVSSLVLYQWTVLLQLRYCVANENNENIAFTVVWRTLKSLFGRCGWQVPGSTIRRIFYRLLYLSLPLRLTPRTSTSSMLYLLESEFSSTGKSEELSVMLRWCSRTPSFQCFHFPRLSPNFRG